MKNLRTLTEKDRAAQLVNLTKAELCNSQERFVRLCNSQLQNKVTGAFHHVHQ